MIQREPSENLKQLNLRPLVLALQSILLSIWSGNANSLPLGGHVVSGKANISTPAPHNLEIQQSTNKSIINWQSYNISKPEHVNYRQPNASSISLNRVQGAEPSGIYGKLSANGQVFLVNPNGVVFGKTARVEVGGLAASTHDINDNDFMAGRYTFNKTPGSKDAKVINEGKLRSKPGGYVALIGSNVTNSGQIQTPKGSTAMAAGERVSLDLRGDGLVNVQVNLAAAKAKVDHKGIIEAPGGKVFLTAQAKDAALDTVLNVEGVVRATSISQHNGVIHLDGGDSGVTKVSGQLLATGNQAGQKGGNVQILGKHVDLASTAIADASGQAGGGKVLVGGDIQGKAGTRSAETTTVQQGARIKVDARNKGNGGQAIVWADKDTRFDGHISARGGTKGGDGGNAEVSGKVNLAMKGDADLRAPKGKFGSLLLDPGSVNIQDGTGTNTGPNSFDDQFIINQLGLGNITIATSSATNGGAETISVAGNTNITWPNPTTLTLNAGQSVTLNSGAVISNTNASTTAFDAIVLNGNTANTPTTVSTYGIGLAAGSVLEAARGSIRLTGHGGSTGDFNQGVLVQGGVGNPVTVRTTNGNISITGTGGAAANPGTTRGVSIETAANLEATGSGRVTIVGNGTTGLTNAGVAFVGGSPTVRTTAGALSITGSGTGVLGGIIFSNSAAQVSSTSGAITLAGSGENNSVNGLLSSGGAVTIGRAGTSGTLTLVADRIGISQFTASTTGTLVVQTATSGRAINIGAADSATTLGLSPAELAGLSAGRLEIGNASAGNLTVSQAYTPTAGTGTLALISGGTIGVNAAITGGSTRLSLAGTAGVRLGAALSLNAANAASEHAITIRTPGTFVNNVGAAALSTPNGNWAISLATPVGQTFNGLLSGNNALWNNPVTSVVNLTGNRYSFALAPTIFIDAGTAIKTYGDALPTTVTVTNAPINSINTFGGVFTDYAGATFDGSYTRSSAGLAATANAGTYNDLAVTSLAGLSSNLVGYTIADSNATGTVRVDPRVITLMPDAQSRVYGNANLARGKATVTSGNLVNGERVNDLALSTPAVTLSSVDSYDLTGSAATFATGLASNYTITYAPRVNGLTVTQRPVTLTPVGVSRSYGDANPATAGASSNSGFGVGLANGDTVSQVSINSPAAATSNVGSYASTGSNAIFGRGLASNYAITYATNATGLNIIPRPLILTPDFVSRVYGDANPAIGSTTGNLGGLVNGDTVASVSLSSPASVTSNVGQYATTGSNAVFGNGLASNYLISYDTNPIGLNITPRPISLVPDQLTRLYGDPNPASGSATVNAGNLVNGDSVGSVFINTPATDTSDIGAYASTGSNATFSNGLASNYAITYDTNANGLIVAQRPVTVTVTPGQQKFFGQSDPSAFDFTFSSLGAGQPLQGNLSRIPGEAIGTYPIGQGSLNGINNPNYLITFVGDIFDINALSSPLPPVEPIPGPIAVQPAQPIIPSPVTPAPLPETPDPSGPAPSIDSQLLAGLFSNTNLLNDKNKKENGSIEVDRLISVKDTGILLPDSK